MMNNKTPFIAALAATGGVFVVALIALGVWVYKTRTSYIVHRTTFVEASSLSFPRTVAAPLAAKRSGEAGINYGSGSETVKLSDGNADLLEQAFQYKKEYAVEDGSRVLLIPHHLVAAREIVSLLASAKKPDVVYVLMPDHFEMSRSAFNLGNADWETVGGTATGSVSLSDGIIKLDVDTQVDNKILANEIAWKALGPYMAKAFGSDTRVVPIMVSRKATLEQRAALADVITQKLKDDENSLLVMTVDFSHYLPAEVADFHDEMALDVVGSLADLETDKIELDSPGTLAIGLKVARELGLGSVTIQAHTNSLRLLNAKISQESTSHILASFAPGEILRQKAISFLFFGDMMFDRTVASRSKKAGGFAYPFDKIRGQENRLMYGQDFTVGNLEGPVTNRRTAPDKGNVDFAFDPKVAEMLKMVGVDAVSQANNHTLDQGRAGAVESKKSLEQAGVAVFGDQVLDDKDSSLKILNERGQKVALLGFNVTDNELDRDVAEKAIEEARASADYIIVNIHWGNEYQAKPSVGQIQLAHWFVDRGVDAVIGAHPHWMQSVEVYKDAPIAYSLGNFIFDQDWSVETNFGLTVGLVLGEDGTKMYLYPIKIEKSQPKLLTGDERQVRLDRLASISDEALSTQIKDGVLIMK